MAKNPAAATTRGIVILGLLSVFDVLSPAVIPSAGPDVPGPPPWIEALSVVLGLISLILVVLLVRAIGSGRAVAAGLVGCRVLSALTGVPAFFVDGVPGWIVAVVALFILLTAVGCVLIAPALRARPAA
jgi:hypothetical protein